MIFSFRRNYRKYVGRLPDLGVLCIPSAAVQAPHESALEPRKCSAVLQKYLYGNHVLQETFANIGNAWGPTHP